MQLLKNSQMQVSIDEKKNNCCNCFIYIIIYSFITTKNIFSHLLKEIYIENNFLIKEQKSKIYYYQSLIKLDFLNHKDIKEILISNSLIKLQY